MNILRTISRYFTGLVFIFSGLVKGIDPMGSMYKFIDYFTAFQLDALEPLAYILGILLCTAEFIIGFSIFTGIRIRIAAWGMLIFMIGFTPLTLVLAISNPVADCGCFGDAIHLSNWQTFYKNIILSVFTIIVFIERKKYKPLSTVRTEWLIIALITLIFILFTHYNKNHLPMVDFRPYKKGTDILKDMSIPEGAPADEYETTLIYEKDGKMEEFSLDNYPSEDTTWTFVDSETRLISKGYTPPIHDFSLITEDGQDLTDIIISDDGYNLFMLSIKFSDADPDMIKRGIESGMYCRDIGIGFYILTSSTPVINEQYSQDLNILFVDETTMKTIIRSNPGYMVLKEGIITEKWSAGDIPEKDILSEKIMNSYPIRGPKAGTVLIILLSSIIALSIIINIILRKN